MTAAERGGRTTAPLGHWSWRDFTRRSATNGRRRPVPPGHDVE